MENGPEISLDTLEHACEISRKSGVSERSFEPLRDRLEGIEAVFVVLDARGAIVCCNKYLKDITGWRREEIQGRDWFGTFIPAEERKEMRGFFFNIIKNKHIPPSNDNNIVTRHGDRVMVAWHNRLLKDADGNIVGTASLGRVVSPETS